MIICWIDYTFVLYTFKSAEKITKLILKIWQNILLYLLICRPLYSSINVTWHNVTSFVPFFFFFLQIVYVRLCFVLLFYNKKQSLLWPPTDIVCTLGDTKYNAGIHQEWLKCVAAKLTLPFSWIKKKKTRANLGFLFQNMTQQVIITVQITHAYYK